MSAPTNAETANGEDVTMETAPTPTEISSSSSSSSSGHSSSSSGSRAFSFSNVDGANISNHESATLNHKHVSKESATSAENMSDDVKAHSGSLNDTDSLPNNTGSSTHSTERAAGPGVPPAVSVVFPGNSEDARMRRSRACSRSPLPPSKRAEFYMADSPRNTPRAFAFSLGRYIFTTGSRCNRVELRERVIVFRRVYSAVFHIFWQLVCVVLDDTQRLQKCCSSRGLYCAYCALFNITHSVVPLFVDSNLAVLSVQVRRQSLARRHSAPNARPPPIRSVAPNLRSRRVSDDAASRFPTPPPERGERR